MLHVFVLAAVLWWLIRRRRSPGTALGVFLLWYGIGRFATDFLRIYDDTVAGLTGAQLMCLVMIPTGLWVLGWVRPRLARAEVAEAEAQADTSEDVEPTVDGEVEVPAADGHGGPDAQHPAG
jgi:prolipoprotein diacylglyceryltransferase